MSKKLNYHTYIAIDILKNLPNIINNLGHIDKIIIITDDNISKLYLNDLLILLQNNNLLVDYLVISAGEPSKQLKLFPEIIEQVIEKQPSRNSLLIALGGGVVSDITGFIASILFRGIRYINIATSLMAQIDSSIGGKTGVNSKYGKNLIGSFYPAQAVIIDPSLLKSLPDREYISGYIEAMKHALIAGEEEFLFLEKNITLLKQRDINYLVELITRSNKIKADIVENDPLDNNNIRTLLNLGHSFAHAIEAFCYNNQKIINHGEAVAIGINLAFEYADHIGILEDKFSKQRITHHLKEINSPFEITSIIDKKSDCDDIIKYLLHDKKNYNDNLILILPKKIGIIEVCKVDIVNLKQFLQNIYK